MGIKELIVEEQPLFKRKHALIEIDEYNGVSRSELKKMIAAKYNTNPENVVIRKIKTEYGLNIAKAEVMIYKDNKVIAHIENKHYIERSKEKSKEGENNGQ